MDTQLMLLDEPTSEFDHASIEKVLQIIRDLKNQRETICIVEYRLDVVREIAGRWLDGWDRRICPRTIHRKHDLFEFPLGYDV